MNSKPGIGRLRAAGLVAAGVVAGGVLAVSGLASASTTASPSVTSGTSGSSSSTTTPAPPNAKSSTPVRSDEKAVSSEVAAKLTAAALKAVPGGTVFRVETDAGDAAYEAHMTKADGSLVTVKFDSSFNVTKVETGMGQGDPRPAGAPTGAPMGPNGGPNGGSPSGSGSSSTASPSSSA